MGCTCPSIVSPRATTWPVLPTVPETKTASHLQQATCPVEGAPRFPVDPTYSRIYRAIQPGPGSLSRPPSLRDSAPRSSTPHWCFLLVSWRTLGATRLCYPPAMARVKGTVLHLWAFLYPLRFSEASAEQSHLSVPLDHCLCTDGALTPSGVSPVDTLTPPLWGATQLCANPLQAKAHSSMYYPTDSSTLGSFGPFTWPWLLVSITET